MSKRLTDAEREVRDVELAEYHRQYRIAHPDTRKYKDRRACKRLRLTNTYSRMLQRIYGRCCPRATGRYAGLSILPRTEFFGWAESDPEFNRLFDAWVASGYERRLSPSIDRIDSKLGYQLHNMQWLTLGENASKARNPNYVPT